LHSHDLILRRLCARYPNEELRPFLRADGGDCELVGIEDDLVRVKMTGAGVGCMFASATISGVQERLIAALGMPLRVIPVPHVR
jgi:NifU-like protein